MNESRQCGQNTKSTYDGKKTPIIFMHMQRTLAPILPKIIVEASQTFPNRVHNRSV